MKKYINFNENYNGKLFCDYFTTVRSIVSVMEKGLRVGDIIDIQKDHLTMFQARIINIDFTFLGNNTNSQRTLFVLDVGCFIDQALTMLRHVCGTNEVAIITLEKLK